MVEGKAERDAGWDRAAAQARCDAASGPWYADRGEPHMDGRETCYYRIVGQPGVVLTVTARWYDHEFLLGARTDLPAALAALAALDVAESRIQQLEAALRDALEGMEDMRPYVADYFARKYDHDGYITRARSALSVVEDQQ